MICLRQRVEGEKGIVRYGSYARDPEGIRPTEAVRDYFAAFAIDKPTLHEEGSPWIAALI
jgi:hypothetical protein